MYYKKRFESRFPLQTPRSPAGRFFVGLGWEPRSLYVPDNQTLLKHGVPNLSFSRGVGNCDFDNVLTIKHLSYTLVITTARAIARTGEAFCDDPIAPDVETETPLEDAVAWIQSQ